MRFLFWVVCLLLSCTQTNALEEAGSENVYSLPTSLSIGLPDAQSKNQRRKAVQRIADSSLAINLIAKDKEGNTRIATIGSAIAVEYGKHKLVVTARHVALNDINPRLIFACSVKKQDCISLEPNILIELELIPNIAKDWAVYKTDVFPVDTIPTKISMEPLVLGDPVWLSGMPWGHHPWVNLGNVAWIFNETGKSQVLGLSGFAASGSSGGGVFDEKGFLVGITVAIEISPYAGPQENQVLAVPIRNIWILNP